jgi:tetratricopeptide (TPR) repeat protein
MLLKRYPYIQTEITRANMLTLKPQSKLMLCTTKLLIFCLCLVIGSRCTATTYDELAEIDRICVSSASKCLLSLEGALATSKPNSRQWYRLKLLELDALFALQQFKDLSDEIDRLLTRETLPLNFSVYVYLYHAKLSFGKKELSQAHEYLDKAINLLTQINDKYPKPMRLIEIANLQISMKDFGLAKDTLLQLELKFENRYHPIFKRELYANLGHVAYFQNDKPLHIKYRKQSLSWALKANNNQQAGIAYNNLAWAYQQTENYKFAEVNYAQSIKLAQMEQDDINGSISQLRLIEVVFLQEKLDQALILFNNLPAGAAEHYSAEHHKKLYQHLKLSLKQ